MKPTERYFDSNLNAWVNIYGEKKVKRIPWQRGEAYLAMKMRIPSDTGMIMHQFTRKNGKY